MPTGLAQMSFGFPKKHNYSLSHWLQSVHGDALLDHRTTPELPQSVDIVIIGSGITGTLIAKNIVATWPEKKVIVLEARQFCSGATGRNTGHCKPDQWRGFKRYEGLFGTEQALKILQNEQQTWSDLVRYIRENEVDSAANANDIFESYKAAGGKVDNIKVTKDPMEAAKISGIKDAQACYAWSASTLHPWKLVAHIMRDNLRRGVNLQTNTLVTKITKSLRNDYRWIVQSERGQIECATVVYATNAYSSALEPSLRGLIVPTPHMCNKVIPPKTIQDRQGLENSYGVLLPKGDLFSINPRRNEGYPVLFGGSNPGQHELEKWLTENPDRCTDDGLLGFRSVTEAVQEFAEGQFKDWTYDPPDRTEAYKEAWSGIMGLSLDGVPFVGEVPGLASQWICAAYHGQYVKKAS
ncbi:uncharacterized protein N7482_005017 [Penicillium canariense]|uniref:FAD dependent oxidoreductase domain-containing protein n=1 Tax=Penicillium canariense TaxID=189055 RepID=A0A9W9I1Q9_9EURO|nr:uncharacterized protein N7482_005017 [Penicillium canariense]KAJ5166236.1 hypothetical protein N7482_005017 [Penicillium canariense]